MAHLERTHLDSWTDASKQPCQVKEPLKLTQNEKSNKYVFVDHQNDWDRHPYPCRHIYQQITN